MLVDQLEDARLPKEYELRSTKALLPLSKEIGATRGNKSSNKDMVVRRKIDMLDRLGPGRTTITFSTEEPQGGSDKSATGAKQVLKLTSEETAIGTWNMPSLTLVVK